MRTIDADALIEKCGGWYVDECTESGFIGTLENLLATEPTIQPQSTTGQLNDGARSTAQSTDLIDRQAAIDAVDKYDFNIPEYMEGFVTKLRDAMKEDLREDIAGLPPTQPEPQEGHWINGKCDLCGEHAPFWCMASTYHESKYCPNCGAKMTTSK